MLGGLLTDDNTLGVNDGAVLVLGTADGTFDGNIVTEGKVLGTDIAFAKLDVQTKPLLRSQPVDLVQSLITSSVVQRRVPASSQTAFDSSQVLFL